MPYPIKPPEVFQHDAAVLFADISGFTPLTEKMSKLGPKGIDLMSESLNNYFDQLIDIIHQHGGDIIKFAGDALLAVWTTNDIKMSLEKFIVLASQCSLTMQEKLKGYLAQGCPLTLHSGIGAGKISGLHVGGESDRYEFLITGDPLEQVGECEKRAEPGQVYISHEAWILVSQSKCSNAISVAMVDKTQQKIRKKENG